MTPPLRILVIGSSADESADVERLLSGRGWSIQLAAGFGELDRVAGQGPFSVAVAFPDSLGVDPNGVLARMAVALPSTPVLLIAATAEPAWALEALASGAQEVLCVSQLDGEALHRAVRHAVERAKVIAETRSLVDNNSDAIVVVNHEGVLRYVNEAAESLFRRSRHELLGELFGFPIGTKSSAELEIVGGDGPRVAEMRVAEIHWNGEPAYVASLRDVTDRRRADELQQRLWHSDRLAAVGQLAAGVAHEVNNPASFVLGSLRLIDDELSELSSLVSGDSPPPADEVRRRLSQALALAGDCRDGVERVTKLVRELRAFSRIEEDEAEHVDVNVLVETACTLALNEIRHRAKLTKSLEDVPRIVADGPKLVQVVINLLVNAAQAIAEGSAASNLVEVTTSSDEDYVVIAVRDTGCGIGEQDRRRIFEPFFTTKAREVGTGLGLALSGEIVRRHGGEIRLESKLGEGSRFEVVLPRQTGLDPRPQRALPTGAPAARRGRVLLVDDEVILLRVHERLLKKRHDVTTARSGREALELLEQGATFDAIVCDLMMPDVDGVGVHEAVQKRFPELVDRIIFCSGGAFTTRTRRFIKSVPNFLLEKPFNPDLLLRVIDQVCATGHSGPPPRGA